jgi:hypothetical protein
MITRQEHLKWCRERAIAEMDYYKDPSKAIISMMSDLGKHSETASEALMTLCTMQLMMKPHMSRQEAINFLNGFN